MDSSKQYVSSDEFLAQFLCLAMVLLLTLHYIYRQYQKNSSRNELHCDHDASRSQLPIVLESKRRKPGWKISSNLQLCEIGVNFNRWRKPVSVWGPYDDDMKSLHTPLDIGDVEWKDATDTVDIVLNMLLHEMKANVNKDLIIEKYVRQGSSREGLKVSEANEFDVLMLFNIKDLSIEVDHLTDKEDYLLPEFGRLVVSNETNLARYAWFLGNDLIHYDESLDKFCLNSRKLHEKVFISNLQRAAHEVQMKVAKENENKDFKFTIEKFRKNPPAVNIEISIWRNVRQSDVNKSLGKVNDSFYVITGGQEAARSKERTLIDVDIVPGIQLRMEPVPDPTDWRRTMECPRYAVFRWVETSQPAATKYSCPPELRWRICTSGYEKHVIDVARGSRQQSYILTALRIMKWKFIGMKENYEHPQLYSHLRSYHLKHIAFYCILYLTVLNQVNLSGVREALAYFLDFLGIALSERKLPHFFHANEFIVYMFPDYKLASNTLRYDLFFEKTEDCLVQAMMSFKKAKLKEKLCPGVLTFAEYSETFRNHIRSGKYYTGSYCTSPDVTNLLTFRRRWNYH